MTVSIFTGTGSDAAGFRQAISELAGPTEDIQLSGLFKEFAHCFLGVEFFDGSGDPVTMTAGTVTVQIGIVVNGQALEDPPDNVIDATAPTSVSWDGNTDRVVATPAALAGTGFATWRLRLICNRD